jgi:hypothetical protein
LSGLRQRRAWVIGFGTTMAVLIAASEWLLPGWFSRFREGIAAYRSYTTGGGVLEALFSPVVGNVLTVVLVLIVLVLCWKFRRVPESRPEFQQITSLVLAATVAIIPAVVPYNQVLLVPAILVAARQWSTRASQLPIARALSIAACVVIAWPWLAATVLASFSAILPPEQVQKAWAAPLVSSLFIPIVVVALQLVSFARQEEQKPQETG